MTIPSANQVAWAIVAACRETKEDPESIALQQPLNARHYALHALSRVFPEVPKDHLAKAVGCVGDGRKFWNNSIQQKFKMFVGGSRSGKRVAKWWDEAAFERVIAAVQDVSTIEVPAPVRHAPIKLNAKVGSIVEPTRPAAMPGKRRLEDILREAVNNTQRMTPPPEKQP